MGCIMRFKEVINMRYIANQNKKESKSHTTVVLKILLCVAFIIILSQIQQIDRLKLQVTAYRESVSELKKANATEYTSTSYDYQTAKETTLSDGNYVVGTDIPAGTYNVRAISGYGLLKGDFQSGFVSTAIGISDLYPDRKEYKNLKLTNEDEFTIKSGVTLKFTPK